MKLINFIVMVFTAMTVEAQEANKAAVDSVLTHFYEYAAGGHWDAYFDLMSEDAVFLGTDPTERWRKSAFERYARVTQGWTYDLRERHVSLAPDGNSAWFDELLWNAGYGLCRGTGVLIKTDRGWLISQYHLTIPIPNERIRDVIPLLKPAP